MPFLSQFSTKGREKKEKKDRIRRRKERDSFQLQDGSREFAARSCNQPRLPVFVLSLFTCTLCWSLSFPRSSWPRVFYSSLFWRLASASFVPFAFPLWRAGNPRQGPMLCDNRSQPSRCRSKDTRSKCIKKLDFPFFLAFALVSVLGLFCFQA